MTRDRRPRVAGAGPGWFPRGDGNDPWGDTRVKSVEPEVFLVARPELDYDEVARYLRDVGGEGWLERLDRGELDDELNDPQNLAEFAGGSATARGSRA